MAHTVKYAPFIVLWALSFSFFSLSFSFFFLPFYLFYPFTFLLFYLSYFIPLWFRAAAYLFAFAMCSA